MKFTLKCSYFIGKKIRLNSTKNQKTLKVEFTFTLEPNDYAALSHGKRYKQC